MAADTLFITDQVQIPTSELSYRYARSGGPGGQHVNRTETQVELLWDVLASPSVNEDMRLRLMAALANRIDKNGTLHLRSSETRSQERNRQAVTGRFVFLLQEALKPRRKRQKTRISKAAKARRRDQKRRRSEVKRGRGRVLRED
ncbi:MAG: aminoacyl-tRNA hydrolase [Chloroflexi bacterium]|nr:aminoacyl-tRNA hydrolase [Chloroflexota bacterium]